MDDATLNAPCSWGPARDFAGTVDYLLSQRLVITHRLGLLPGQLIQRLGGLPNANMPSDHQPLLARYVVPESLRRGSQHSTAATSATSWAAKVGK